MELTIRKVLPEDAYNYTACHIACWQAAYRGIIPDGYLDNMQNEQDSRTERLTAALLDPGDDEFYCAEYEGRIVGRLIICKSRSEDKPDAGEIIAIYLLKEFWDKGYGRKLMDYILDRLRVLGYREVILWALEENKRARRFYEKCGFTLDEARAEIVIEKPLAEVRYSLKLS